MAFENLVLSIVAYGLYLACVTSVAFTIHARHAYGLFAMSKIEKVSRGIRDEKSSKDMASSRNLVSTIGAQASPTMGDGTRCRKDKLSLLACHTRCKCCNEMYHNVLRYEYLTFQTQIYLHKQYIFDANIIQSKYAFLFPFSILRSHPTRYNSVELIAELTFSRATCLELLAFMSVVNRTAVSMLGGGGGNEAVIEVYMTLAGYHV